MSRRWLAALSPVAIAGGMLTMAICGYNLGSVSRDSDLETVRKQRDRVMTITEDLQRAFDRLAEANGKNERAIERLLKMKACPK